jgi:hypothetical protein
VSLASLVVKGVEKKPPRIVVYGAEGIGKSTFGASCPDPILLPCEDGAARIDCDKFPLIKTYQTFLDHLYSLSQEDHKYQTVVVDTIDWLERLVWSDVSARGGKDSIEDFGYGKGYILALDHWREVLSALDHLRDERGMIVVLLAHARIERFQDPESDGFDRYTLKLNKHADAIVREWADAVLFACRKQRVEKIAAGASSRNVVKPVGKDGGDRVLRCSSGPAAVAKNRFGITGEIAFSWDAISEHL